MEKFKKYNITVPVVSGGLDSVALTGMLLENGAQVYPITFKRGQRNFLKERKATMYFDHVFSNIYKDKYNKSKMVTLPTPPEEIKEFGKEIGAPIEMSYFMRNHIMGIVAMQYAHQIAYKKGLDVIPAVLLGSVITDTTYGDGKKEVINSMQETLREGQLGRFPPLVYEAPFVELRWDKADYLTWLFNNAPEVFSHIHKSWSCGEMGDLHCGEDNSCLKRKEAFEKAGLEDLTMYKNGPSRNR